MGTVYITSINGKLSCSNGSLLYSDADGSKKTLFPHLVDSISSTGTINITASAMSLLIQHSIPLYFMTRSGKPNGQLSFGSGKNVFLRQKQYQLLGDEHRLHIAANIVLGKLRNQRRFLQRCGTTNAEVLSELSDIENNVQKASTMESIRGYEGIGARIYFDGISHHIPEWTGFHSRNRRPPKDPFNSVLSFLYTLLCYRLESSIEAEGLDPAIGVFHDLAYGRPSLAYDIMEEFRVPLGDAIACTLFRRNQLGPDDFTTTDNTVSINKPALGMIIKAFEGKLHDCVMYPPENRPIPYQEIIGKQIHHFRTILEGEAADYTPMYFR